MIRKACVPIVPNAAFRQFNVYRKVMPYSYRVAAEQTKHELQAEAIYNHKFSMLLLPFCKPSSYPFLDPEAYANMGDFLYA